MAAKAREEVFYRDPQLLVTAGAVSCAGRRVRLRDVWGVAVRRDDRERVGACVGRAFLGLFGPFLALAGPAPSRPDPLRPLLALGLLLAGLVLVAWGISRPAPWVVYLETPAGRVRVARYQRAGAAEEVARAVEDALDACGG
jgi:hypothetical protein